MVTIWTQTTVLHSATMKSLTEANSTLCFIAWINSYISFTSGTCMIKKRGIVYYWEVSNFSGDCVFYINGGFFLFCSIFYISIFRVLTIYIWKRFPLWFILYTCVAILFFLAATCDRAGG